MQMLFRIPRSTHPNKRPIPAARKPGKTSCYAGQPHELRSKANLAKEILGELENYPSVCSYPHTTEFRYKINMNPEIYHESSGIILGDKIGDPKGYVEIEFHDKTYRMSIGDFIRKT